MTPLRSLLHTVADAVADARDEAAAGPVVRAFEPDAVRSALGPLPGTPQDAATVTERLVAAVGPALVATSGPRYFGFVIGGATDAATAADMLATGWDQCAFNSTTSPAAAIVEEVAGRWLVDVLGLPDDASFGFTTGAQGANTIALAAARHHVLGRVGWDVEHEGLHGAPAVRVVANGERHATIDRALRLLGLGVTALVPVETGPDGTMSIDQLRRVLGGDAEPPTIVCAQAGNVNTGAFDDLRAVCELARDVGAWVHVDGAFGLWAAACTSTRHLVDGHHLADSWAVDGHKWLNVPYDSGYVACAHPDAHAAAMSYTAAYLTGQGAPGVRAPSDYVTESSRRARGFATWAALAELGRDGIDALVARTCASARRFASELGGIDGVAIGNDVVLNQVLVRFGDDDASTDRVVEAVQRSGECWMGATTWRGARFMRISVANWTTTEADVDRAVAAIASAWRAERATHSRTS